MDDIATIRRCLPAVTALFRSALAVRLLLYLAGGPQTLQALAGMVGSSPGAVHRVLKHLAVLGLAEEADGAGVLTNCGTILAKQLIPMLEAFHGVPGDERSACLLAEQYPVYEQRLKSIFLSAHVLTILASLRKGPVTPEELRAITGARSSTLRPKLKKLLEDGLIVERHHRFLLSRKGEAIVSRGHAFLMTAALVAMQREFWNGHAIGDLPGCALESLSDLIDVEINDDTPENIAENLNLYFDFVERAEWIYGISGWVSTRLSEEYAKPVMAGTPIEMIYPAETTCLLFREPYIEKMQYYDLYPNFRVWVYPGPARFGLTVTDSLFVLKLHARDGVTFSTSRLRAVASPRAIAWGRRVFDHVRRESVPIEEFLADYRQRRDRPPAEP